MARYETQLAFRYTDDTLTAVIAHVISEQGLKVMDRKRVHKGGCVILAKLPKASMLERDRPSVRIAWFHPREDAELFWLTINVETMGVKREVIHEVTQLGDNLMGRIQELCEMTKGA